MVLSARSQEMKALHDKVDQIRDVLRNDRNGSVDQQFLAELEAKIPQIVVIGMQSSGKSSVLERLSGIKFPSKETLCTRVPAVLRLRRGPKLETVVTLKGRDGSSKVFQPLPGDMDESNRIESAQRSAVPDGKKISDEHWIEIAVQDPDRVDLTVVDLPGHFQPDDNDDIVASDMVKAMGERYIDMKGSIVLHVMGVTEDHGNVATKISIANARTKDADKVIITVFTKVDLLANTDRDKALVTMNNYLEKSPGDRFAVIGNFNGHGSDESNAIAKFGLFHNDRCKMGSNSLAEFLETRVAKHIEDCLPSLRDDLEKRLEKIEQWLENNRKLEPAQVVQKVVKSLSENWHKDHGMEVRKALERMSCKVRQQRIEPLEKSNYKVRHWRQAMDDDVEVGDVVVLRRKEGDKTGMDDAGSELDEESQCAASYSGEPPLPESDDEYLNENLNDDDEDLNRGELGKLPDFEAPSLDAEHLFVVTDANQDGFTLMPCASSAGKLRPVRAKLQSLHVPDLEKILMNDVLQTIESRGLLISSNVGPQEILEPYIGDFAKRYVTVLQETVNEVFRISKKTVESSFSRLNNGQSARAAEKQMQKDIVSRLEVLKKSSLRTMERMGRWNQAPVVFSTNESFLYQRIKETEQSQATRSAIDMIKETMRKKAQLMGSAVLIALQSPPKPPSQREMTRLSAAKHIRAAEAFWKLKVRAIIEAATGEIAVTFIVELNEALKEVTTSEVRKYDEFVKEPIALSTEREEKEGKMANLKSLLEIF